MIFALFHTLMYCNEKFNKLSDVHLVIIISALTDKIMVTMHQNP